MAQILVSVRFQGYYLQLLIGKDTTIRQLVDAMRENTFIPNNIPVERLVFSKAEGQTLQLDDLVQTIIVHEQNNVHYLQVDQLPETLPPINYSSNSSQINSSSNGSSIQRKPSMVSNIASTQAEQGGERRGPEFFQAQTNRILQRIVRYLRDGNIQSLLRAKENRRIQSSMAQHLASIGYSFHKLQQQCSFYQRVIRNVNQSTNIEQLQHLIQKQKNEFQQFIPQQMMTQVDQVCELKKKSFESIQRTRLSQRQLNDKVRQVNRLKQEITRLKAAQSQALQKNQTYQNLLQGYKTQQQSLNQQISRIKTQMEQLKVKINQEKQTSLSMKRQYQDNIKNLKEELSKKNQEFQQLKKNNQQTIQALQKLKEQNQELKNYSYHDIVKYKDFQKIKQNDQIPQSKNQKPIVKAIKIGNPIDIIKTKEFSKEIEKYIQGSSGLKISKFNQLLSYNCAQHQNYMLKSDYLLRLTNKSSLLFIGRTDDNKFFGAFTTQKLTQSIDSYYMPDFNGPSFLFSLINNKIQFYQLRQGQNSLIYDPQYLIFGKQDLMVDFKQNMCISRFVNGKYSYYQTDTQNPNNKLFLSDKKENQTSVKVSQYMIYQIELTQKNKRN